MSDLLAGEFQLQQDDNQRYRRNILSVSSVPSCSRVFGQVRFDRACAEVRLDAAAGRVAHFPGRRRSPGRGVFVPTSTPRTAESSPRVVMTAPLPSDGSPGRSRWAQWSGTHTVGRTM